MNIQLKEMINEITHFMENEARTNTVIGDACWNGIRQRRR